MWVPINLGIAPGVAPRGVVFVFLKSWDAIPRMEWNFVFRESRSEFRELLREYPRTVRELREWPFHSESVLPEIGVASRLPRFAILVRSGRGLCLIYCPSCHLWGWSLVPESLFRWSSLAPSLYFISPLSILLWLATKIALYIFIPSPSANISETETPLESTHESWFSSFSGSFFHPQPPSLLTFHLNLGGRSESLLRKPGFPY